MNEANKAKKVRGASEVTGVSGALQDPKASQVSVDCRPLCTQANSLQASRSTVPVSKVHQVQKGSAALQDLREHQVCVHFKIICYYANSARHRGGI